MNENKMNTHKTEQLQKSSRKTHNEYRGYLGENEMNGGKINNRLLKGICPFVMHKFKELTDVKIIYFTTIEYITENKSWYIKKCRQNARKLTV